MPAILTGTVFHDQTRTGRLSPGDSGIPDVTVVLEQEGAGCQTAVTGADGRYTFSLTAAGTCTVYETVIPPDACPPVLVGQPAGYPHANTARKAVQTITQTQVDENQTVAGPDFAHDTLAARLPCDANMTLLSGRPSVRYTVNLITGTATEEGPLSPSADVNAIGYNVLDGTLYGYDQGTNQIVRIDDTGAVTFLSPRPNGMPAAAYAVGTLDDQGFYYAYVPGTDRFYTVDLRPGSSTFLKLVNPANGYQEQTSDFGTPLSEPLSFGDWAFHPSDRSLYGVTRDGAVCRVDVISGMVTRLNTTGPNPGALFGSVVIDGNGDLFAVSNSDGTIYRYTIRGDDAAGIRFSQTQVDAFNDAALCPYAVIELDFGDAPDAGGGGGSGNYNTLLASNGPRHGIRAGLYLGTQVTAEPDAYQNASATGDDLVVGIQDDGLPLPLPLLSINSANYPLSVTVTNQTDGSANLYGWLDFNQNGLFEADEAASVVVIPAYSGTAQYTLDFTRPPNATLRPGHTFLRLRLTTDDLTDSGLEAQDTRSVGPATDGEVEDYLVGTGTTGDLSILKTASPDVLRTGEMIHYTLTIQNNGPEEALNVVLHDPIPPAILDPMYRVDGGPQDRWPGTLVLGDLAPGQVITVEIEGVFDGSTPDPILNTATVTTDSEDPNPDNNSSTTITPVIRSADLTIIKTPEQPTALVGTMLTFLITVINHGPDAAERVVVTDWTDAAFAMPEYSLDGGGTWYPWYGQLDLGTLDPGTDFTFLLRGVVEGGTEDFLANTADVKSETEDPNPDDNTVTVVVPKERSADLFISKTGDPDPVGIGQTILYQITVTNNGPSSVDDSTLTDAVPDVLENAMYSFDQIEWLPWTGSLALGALDAGASVTVYLRATVDPTAASGPLSNTASVDSTTPDPDPVNNSSTADGTIVGAADLAVYKSADPADAIAGFPLTYTLIATNRGPSAAENVVISDPAPEGLESVAFSVDGGVTWKPWPGQDTVPSLAAGASVTLLLRGIVSPAQTADLSNTVMIASDTLDPDPDNNQDTVITPVTASADLSILKQRTDPSAPVVPGETVSYVLTVRNLGPSTAANVVVTDVLPEPVTGAQYWQDGVQIGAWTGSVTLAELAAGASVVLTIEGTVSPSATGTLTNTAAVRSDTPDPDPDNNQDTRTDEIVSSADLSIAKSASPSPAVPGQTLTYTLTVQNAGPSAAENVVLTDDVPDALETPAYSTDGQTWYAWTGQYTVGTLLPGDSVSLSLRGTVALSASGTLSNTASVESQTPDPDPDDNTVTIDTPVIGAADLSLRKTADTAEARLGDIAVYRIVISHLGTVDAENVTLRDDPPDGLENLAYSTDDGVSWQPWTGSYFLGTLPNLESRTILLRGTVTVGTGTLVNTAHVTSDTPDPDDSNNHDAAAISVVPVQSADLSVTKTASAAAVLPMQPVVYTITVRNNGPDAAERVLVYDAVDESLSDVQYSIDSGATWMPWANPYAVGRLESGAARVILLAGQVSASACCRIANTAVVTSTTADPDPVNNSATAVVEVLSQADLAITKTACCQNVCPGAPAEFRITVTNLGPDCAKDVVIHDAVPALLTNVLYTPSHTCAWRPWTGQLALGDLANGASVSFRLSGIASACACGAITNEASVSSATYDPNPENDRDCATVWVRRK